MMDNRTIQNVIVVAARASEWSFILKLTLIASNISESNDVPCSRGH